MGKRGRPRTKPRYYRCRNCGKVPNAGWSYSMYCAGCGYSRSKQPLSKWFNGTGDGWTLCGFCGAAVIRKRKHIYEQAKLGENVYCDTECQAEARRQSLTGKPKWYEWGKESVPTRSYVGFSPIRKCERCEAFVNGRTRTKLCPRCKGKHYTEFYSKVVARDCAWCDQPFVRPVARKEAWFCSRTCAEAKGGKVRARRIASRRRDSGITLQKLIERDGRECARCGIVCRHTGFNQPTNPTIDHIIPIAKGGTDTWDNVQVMCRQCNSTKCASLPPEGAQLTLHLA